MEREITTHPVLMERDVPNALGLTFASLSEPCVNADRIPPAATCASKLAAYGIRLSAFQLFRFPSFSAFHRASRSAIFASHPAVFGV